VADLERLEHLRGVLAAEGHHTADSRLAVFSEHGFTRDLVASAAGRDDVHLIDLPLLYGHSA
jgi:hypothetical protein